MIDLVKASHKVSGFIKTKGDYVKRHMNEYSVAELKEKGRDLSTNFDVEIEKAFSDLVEVNFPGHGFKGEEHPELDKEGEYVWEIDPIDGTKYFAAGVSMWTVTVALMHKGDPVIGIIYNPSTKEFYSAIMGEGSFLNGKRLEINSETDISRLQVGFDITAREHNGESIVESIRKTEDILRDSFYRTRIYGSGTLSLAWLAQGFLGCFVDVYRPDRKSMDTSAGRLICTEAGAAEFQISEYDGLTNTIIAHPEVLKQVKKILGW